jgi:hypothetical protein
MSSTLFLIKTIKSDTMTDLFDTPVKTKKVRKGVTAYQYRNGVINIGGQRYAMYSMTDAVKKFRKDFPAK